MPDQKISAFPAAATLTGTEVVPAVQGAATVKATISAIIAMAQARSGHTGTQAQSTITDLGADLAARALDSSVVKVAGAQTIADVKTFSAAPVVPNASWSIAKTNGLQTALDAKALDTAVVKTTGAQTIAGVKTFSSAPVVPDGSWTIAKTSGLQTAINGAAAGSGFVYAVERYRTTGMSDLAATQAAYADLIANPLGGVLVWSAKSYDLADWNIQPPFDINKKIVLEGQFGTTLNFTVERGTPTPRAALTTTGGTLGVGNYSYRLALVTSAGTFIAGRRAQWAVSTGATNQIVLTWNLPATFQGQAVTGVKIYGRTHGSELLMATLGVVTTWTDTGSIIPAGALPAGHALQAYVVEPSGAGSNVVIRNLIAIGPAPTASLGNAPSHMCFVNMKSRAFIENLDLRYWYSGANFTGDHAIARNIKTSANYYGMNCANQTSGHDNILEDCQLDGNMMASFGIAPDSFMGGVSRSGHMGVSPYAIYIEPGAKTSTASIFKWMFDGTSFEAAGAGYIFDENFNAIVNGVTMRDNGNFSLNNPAYSFGGRAVLALFRAAQILNWRIDAQDSLGLSDPASPPVWFDAGYLSAIVWDNCLLTFALIPQMASFDLSYGKIAMKINHTDFVGAVYRPAAAITAGQLCEINADGDAVPHTTRPILGVALNTVSAYNGTTQRRGVVIASEALGITMLTPVGASIATTDVLMPDAADPSKVNKSLAAGKPIIGRLATGSANGSAGTVTGFLRMGGVTV